MQKRLQFSLAISCALIFTALFCGARAQEDHPSWSQTLTQLKSQRAQIKDYKASFRIAINNLPPSDLTGKTNYQVPTDNRAYSAAWAVKGPLWRAEVTELYPSDKDHEMLSYFGGSDGEKFYFYDPRRNLGTIAPTASQLPGGGEHFLLAIENPDYNCLGLDFPLEKIVQLEASGISFKYRARERIGQIECILYEAQGHSLKGRFKINLWLAQDKNHVITRFDEENLIEENGKVIAGSISVYKVNKFRQIMPQFAVAEEASREYYQIPNGKVKWLNTTTFFLHDMVANTNPPREKFLAEFLPGTPVENLIDNPGALATTGGSGNDVVALARQSIPPLLTRSEGETIKASEVSE